MGLEIYNRNGQVTLAELQRPGALDGPIFFGPGAFLPDRPAGVDTDVQRAVRDVGEIASAGLPPIGGTRLAKASHGLVKVGLREIKRYLEDGGAFRFGNSCRATTEIRLADVPFFFGLTPLGQELRAADPGAPPFASADGERCQAHLAALTEPLRKLLEAKGYGTKFSVGPSYDGRTRELSLILELPPRERP